MANNDDNLYASYDELPPSSNLASDWRALLLNLLKSPWWHFRHYIATKIKEKVDPFWELCVDDDNYHRLAKLRPSLREKARNLVFLDTVRISTLIFTVFIPMALFVYSMPIISMLILSEHKNLDGMFNIFDISVNYIIYIWVISIFALLYALLVRELSHWLTPALLVFVLISLFILILFLSPYGIFLRFHIQTTPILVMLLFLYAIYVSLFVTIANYTFQKIKCYWYPDAVFSIGLIDLVADIKYRPEHWMDVNFRREIMKDLELVAQCLEHYLPRSLRSDDRAFDLWMHKASLRRATALRSLKKTICLPATWAQEEVANQLVRASILAAGGDWQNLPQQPPPILTPRQKFAWVVDAARTIVVAFLPLASLQVYKHIPNVNQIPDSISTWLDIGVFVWIVITLLEKLNDGVKSKIGILDMLTKIFGR